MGKKEIKEPFCGACAAGVTALIGAGTVGGSSASKNKKTKKIIFGIGLFISIISIIILIYFIFFKKCNECR
jgi:hypothetical protein